MTNDEAISAISALEWHCCHPYFLPTLKIPLSYLTKELEEISLKKTDQEHYAKRIA